MSYNGHRNWDHWNVSLWINNDEGLYMLLRELWRHHKAKAPAAADFIGMMREVYDTPKTPDGAPYSKASVIAAMAGW